MKYLKPLISLSIVSVIVLAIFYLYRRTNILLSSINSLRSDVASLKSLLKGPSSEPTVGAETNEPFVNTPINKLEVKSNINNHKIQDTQQNITLLKTSIERLENMISSSEDELEESSVSGTESDEEEEIAAAGDVDDVDENLNSNNLLSYGLDAPETNSELEGLLDSKNEVNTEEEDVSRVLSPQESNLEKTIIDQVKIDVILKSYSKKQLENLCGENYLSKSGSKSVLIKRCLDNGHEFKINQEKPQENLSQN